MHNWKDCFRVNYSIRVTLSISVLILVTQVSLYAQNYPGPEGLVIEIDPDKNKNDQKNLGLALGMSTLLPGTGEYYLHDKIWSKTFLLAEAGFWTTLFFAWQAKESYLQSARHFASVYADAQSGGRSEAYLEEIGSYRSYQENERRQDSYEAVQILSGKRDGDYPIKPIEANYWDFGSASSPQNTAAWRDYQDALRHHRRAKIAVSFAIGALALSRAASIVNTLHLYRSTTSFGLSAQSNPILNEKEVGWQVSFNFPTP